jgi:hypothetical protein
MSVIAKFKVEYKSQPYAINQWLSDEAKSGIRAVQDVVLRPVSGDGAEENKKFFASTPNGSITMSIVNTEAASKLVVGKEYYVRFEEATNANHS